MIEAGTHERSPWKPRREVVVTGLLITVTLMAGGILLMAWLRPD